MHITLPDGGVRSYERPVSGAELAHDISLSLAKAAVAIRVDGAMKDLAAVIERDAGVAVVTAKDPEALELIRHDAAHVMAEAVQELFPGTQVTIGPAIENGFYYDFARDEPFTPEDLPRIEERMREIVDRDEEITREIWDRSEAIDYFESIGEHYKAEIIAGIPAGEAVSIYRQGNWLDLCRGPHLPSTGKLPKAFKLTKLAGAYWRGDSRNAMLQRIYGTAWAHPKQLEAYLTLLEEAEKRDHRRLGREMELFHFQEEAAGSVFWHPKGWTLYRVLQDYMRARLEATGYVEVRTPQLYERTLWEKSGHWEKFREHMFTVESEDKVLGLKPMNCPGHVQIYKQGIKSYRDLPLRMAEFGSCHRNEPSGALHGLMRVRAFTQDDAHIFCTEAQITAETLAFCDLLRGVYNDFGFSEIVVKFSDRPPMRAGSDETWDKAEGGAARGDGAGRHPGQPQSRRGRVLRAEAGVRAARRHRPRLAARHPAGRLRAAGAARRDLRRRGRREAPAGDAAPGDPRVLRTLHRHPRRELRRPAAAVAGPIAGGGGDDHQRGGRLRAPRAAGAARGGAARRGRSAQREDRLQGTRAFARQGTRNARRGWPGEPGKDGGHTPTGQSGARKRCLGRSHR